MFKFLGDTVVWTIFSRGIAVFLVWKSNRTVIRGWTKSALEVKCKVESPFTTNLEYFILNLSDKIFCAPAPFFISFSTGLAGSATSSRKNSWQALLSDWLMNLTPVHGCKLLLQICEVPLG